MKSFFIIPSLLIFSMLQIIAVCAQQPEQYDMILKGGHFIDPANDINEVMGVAILDGKIARVAQNIPASMVKQQIDKGNNWARKCVIDLTGYHVTPGLIDMHSHIFFTFLETRSIKYDDVCFLRE